MRITASKLLEIVEKVWLDNKKNHPNKLLKYSFSKKKHPYRKNYMKRYNKAVKISSGHEKYENLIERHKNYWKVAMCL